MENTVLGSGIPGSGQVFLIRGCGPLAFISRCCVYYYKTMQCLRTDVPVTMTMMKEKMTSRRQNNVMVRTTSIEQV